MGIWAPAHWGLGEINGLLDTPGKASNLLTDHLITGQLLKSEPAQEKWFSQTTHTYKSYWLSWVANDCVSVFYCHKISKLKRKKYK